MFRQLSAAHPLFFFLLTAASCQFEPTVQPPGHGQVDAGGPGLRDAGNRSDSATEDGSILPDAPLVNCVETIAFKDDFEDGLIDVAWEDWTSGEFRIDESDGIIDMIPKFSANGTSAGVRPYDNSDLTGKRFYIEIDEMVNTSQPIAAVMFLGQSRIYHYLVIQTEGRLQFRRKLPSETTSQTLANVAFNLESHRFWQLRETDGVIYAEAGPSMSELDTFALDIIDSNGKKQIIEESRPFVLVESIGESFSNAGSFSLRGFNVGDNLCP